MIKLLEKPIITTLLTLAFVISPAAISADESSNERWLFSEEEAVEYRLDVDPATLTFGMAKSIGPIIEITMPEVTPKSGNLPLDVVNFQSPGGLLVKFSQNQAPVDMDSLTVKFRGKFLRGDITKRLAPYVQGNSIKAEDIKIPGGDYILVVSVADQQKNETVMRWILKAR